jgi:hypothetical protein
MSESKKAPCIDVRTDVHKDERFKVLGDLGGYNHYEALGRMHALWSWCRDRGLKDTLDGLDGYVVSEAVVRRFLGANGVTAILGDGVDDFALASALDEVPGMLYLRGTSEYVAAARAHQATSKAGGEARARGARNPAGQFVSETTNAQPEPSRTPADKPAADQPTPASSLLPLPSSQDQNSPAAGAIAPSADYNPDSTADRLRLAEATYTRIADARAALIAELGLRNEVPMPAARIGTPSEPSGIRELRARIRDEGAVAPQACDRVVATLVADAREERSVVWLSDKAFTEAAWREARNGGGGKRKRAGPKRGAPTYGATNPSNKHPEEPALRPASEVL